MVSTIMSSRGCGGGAEADWQDSGTLPACCKALSHFPALFRGAEKVVPIT
jgi:hypothetical protein